MYTMVGVKRISFLMPENASLQEKRQVIRKLREAITNRFNVSFAEIYDDDKMQRSMVAISMVSSNEELIRTAFDQISNFIGSLVEVRVFNDANDVFRYENETKSIQLS